MELHTARQLELPREIVDCAPRFGESGLGLLTRVVLNQLVEDLLRNAVVRRCVV